MILFQYPGGDGLSSVSPPCMRVEMALRLCGAEFRVQNLMRGGEVKRVSSTGRLPVLEVDGRRIPDSIAILDALEQRFPEGPWPRDPAQCQHDRLWEHFANDHLYWVGYYFRWCDPDNRARMAQAVVGRAPFVVRLMFKRFFLPGFVARGRMVGVAGKSREEMLAMFERGTEMVEQGLAGGPFLQGRDQPGRGDLACVSLMAQAGYRGVTPELLARLQGKPALLAHTRGVLEASSMKLPRWLEG